MRHSTLLATTLLAFAGAAQATDWPQGSWCEVQSDEEGFVLSSAIEYHLAADGSLSRSKDRLNASNGRWQATPDGLILDGEVLGTIRRDRTGFTARSAHAIRLFLAGACVEREASFWLTLETAIREAKQADVLKMLADPALLNARDTTNIWGHTPLSLAVMHRQTDIVKALLAAGARPDLVNDAGQSPLLLAMKPGVPDAIAETLLAAGAPVDSADSYGRTALFWAAAHKRFAIAERLLDAGADPKRRWTSSINEEVSTIASSVLSEPGLPAALAARLAAMSKEAQ